MSYENLRYQKQKAKYAGEVITSLVSDHGFKNYLDSILMDKFSQNDKAVPSLGIYDVMNGFVKIHKTNNEMKRLIQSYSSRYYYLAFQDSKDFICLVSNKYPALSSPSHENVLLTEDFIKYMVGANTLPHRVIADLEKACKDNKVSIPFTNPPLPPATDKDIRNALRSVFSEIADEKPGVFSKKFKRILSESNIDSTNLTAKQIHAALADFVTLED